MSQDDGRVVDARGELGLERFEGAWRDVAYAPGERISGSEFVVIRELARGGHGILYLVRHHFLEKKIYVLKTVRALDPSPGLAERLKHEAQMLAGFNHKHIVQVVSGGFTDEPVPRPYFVMERACAANLSRTSCPPQPMASGSRSGFRS